MSYCELYARRVIAELEPLLRPQGGGRLALPRPGSPERDALWEISEARFNRVHELLEGADAGAFGLRPLRGRPCLPRDGGLPAEHAHIGAVTVESAAQLLGGEGYAFAPDRLEESSRALGELLWTGGIAVARLPRAARGGRAAGRLARRPGTACRRRLRESAAAFPRRSRFTRSLHAPSCRTA